MPVTQQQTEDAAWRQIMDLARRKEVSLNAATPQVAAAFLRAATFAGQAATETDPAVLDWMFSVLCARMLELHEQQEREARRRLALASPAGQPPATAQ